MFGSNSCCFANRIWRRRWGGVLRAESVNSTRTTIGKGTTSSRADRAAMKFPALAAEGSAQRIEFVKFDGAHRDVRCPPFNHSQPRRSGRHAPRQPPVPAYRAPTAPRSNAGRARMCHQPERLPWVEQKDTSVGRARRGGFS